MHLSGKYIKIFHFLLFGKFLRSLMYMIKEKILMKYSLLLNYNKIEDYFISFQLNL